MDNVNFDASGEDIERALMDLGPLLGVAIKEEAPDELAAPAAPAAPPSVVSACDGAEGERPGADSGERADSLASPRAGTALSAARCALCGTALALAHGTPKLMECLHSACEPCINAKIEEKQASRDFCGGDRITVQCPVCRLQCQPANMIDQRFVLEKMCPDTPPAAAERDQHCSSCEEPEPATSYCADCAEFICDSCVQAHQRLKITKDHTIKSKDEAIQEQQASQPAAHDMFCSEHPQERLSLFCETCDRLTCRDCQLQHHRDHKYQFSTEMAQQARAHIASLLSEVSYKRVLLGSAMKVIRERQVLIADKKKALVHEITQTVVKLTNAINTRGKQLVLRLNEVCDGKQRTLSEKKDALEQLANITDHCVEFVSAALQQGSDTAVLYSKRAVCAHLQRIKSRRADIPNPEIPVRIALALDKLPDLVKVLSSIGAIVVDGKVDGGGAAAQGPYHPPAPAAQPPPHPAQPPPHAAQPAAVSAALHHAAAMHQQSYAGAGMGGAGAGAGGYMAALASLRARPLAPHQHQHQHQHQLQHTPLRHAHVTSTTHPHHLHGMSELNLRGLLNQGSGRGAARSPLQSHPAMHHYQQMMGAYANSAYAAAAAAGGGGGAGGRRSGGPRTPSPAPHAPHTPPQAAPQPAKWHIPQQGLVNGGFDTSTGMSLGSGSPGAGGAGAGADFKITLGRARAAPPPAVTSTNPKTPSPSLNGGAGVELDKVCAESVQDLMATIAKLDSNGVQVLPEQPRAEPAVHSSTDTAGAARAAPRRARRALLHRHRRSVTLILHDIYKLDSNGVQVLPEQPRAEPAVHSSTDTAGAARAAPRRARRALLHRHRRSVTLILHDIYKLDSYGVHVLPEQPRAEPAVHSSTDTAGAARTAPRRARRALLHRHRRSVTLILHDIYKLDSNGVQVLPEQPRAEPAVHSSTDTAGAARAAPHRARRALLHRHRRSVTLILHEVYKLDSNGVQVLPEQPRAEPAVHSSTDTAGAAAAPAPAAAAAAGDPNEDWCAVCMDGGELMCCDKCPKVFHQYCHIPTIEKLPDETETWQCLLCVNFAELAEEPRAAGEPVSPREQKLMERVTLELYCQYEPSLPFREPVSQLNHDYHSKVYHHRSSWSASRSSSTASTSPACPSASPSPSSTTTTTARYTTTEAHGARHARALLPVRAQPALPRARLPAQPRLPQQGIPSQKLMERVTLELYCQYEPSLPFREPVSQLNHDYHSKLYCQYEPSLPFREPVSQLNHDYHNKVYHHRSSWSASRSSSTASTSPACPSASPSPSSTTTTTARYTITEAHGARHARALLPVRAQPALPRARLPAQPRLPQQGIPSQKLMERVTLELYCQYEPSLPFREPVSQLNHDYHSKISRPMCLDMIRMKLQPRSPTRYAHVAHFVQDVRLMFRNARLYNPPESSIYKDAVRLEQFFDASLEKWLPEYAYWSGEGEPPAKRKRSD
ncbi:E3 ubiquitin-protein ligase TRIM33 [Cydia fagiglandana]|uniref:E3 ubiquitin-protein ligase TRIM33 n=1 Tax=Cydia fagiglandana TaxID=1458189 RepID=UPI002FEE5643